MQASYPQLNILLVDDNEDDTLLAQRAFARVNVPHNLETLHSAREALDYLKCEGKYASRRKTTPDLLLLDINMPGRDGFALLRALKADPALKKIPAVMLTSSVSREDITRCYEYGAASFMSKPDSFEGYSSLLAQFSSYWISVSLLPQ
jgi:two-component system response regulator